MYTILYVCVFMLQIVSMFTDALEITNPRRRMNVYMTIV